MSNERGYYGKNGVHVGEAARTVYVEREHHSIGKWILGAVAVGGAVLFARHQAKQIEELHKSAGLPYQSLGGSIREGVKELPTKARAAYRGIVGRPRPAIAAAPPVAAAPSADEPAHSVKARR